MVEILRLNTDTGVDELLDLIHDYWFDLDEIKYDPAAQQLKIPLSQKIQRKKSKILTKDKNKLHPKRYIMLIKKVLDVEIVDSEKVGSYDINNIAYKTDTKSIVINTGIPLKFGVNVKDFEINLFED